MVAPSIDNVHHLEKEGKKKKLTVLAISHLYLIVSTMDQATLSSVSSHLRETVL